MNDTAHSPAAVRGPFELMAAMLHTRLELATMDIEAHLSATLASLAMAFAALVLGLVAFAFIGVAVIAVFWDTHRVLAAALTTAAYAVIACTLVVAARARWRSRPAPLAATLHELQLDREAVRQVT
jgi:uncharacterized membrane protein YqjE